MSRYLLALCLVLVSLSQVGCYATSAVSELANKTDKAPEWEVHKQIHSAWITNQNELLIYCEGEAYDIYRHESFERYYKIQVPLDDLKYEERQGNDKTGRSIESFDAGYGKYPDREFKYLVMSRRSLKTVRTLDQVPPPDSTPVAIVSPPEGWHLANRDDFPLPEGETNALFIDRTETNDGRLLVYVASKPIWTAKGKHRGIRCHKSLNRSAFTVHRQELYPNSWISVLTPAAFILDTALLPIYVPIFIHELKVAIHGE
jgi:hypothetical protein